MLYTEFSNIKILTFLINIISEEQVSTAVKSIIKQFFRINISVYTAGVSHIPNKTHELQMSD